MERRVSAYMGALVGLAVGDGLGHGPETVNGFLPTSGYTQMAAYGCCGLLLGLTRGQLSGAMAPPVRYMSAALNEWAALQLWRDTPVRCWISRSDRLGYRRCPEPGVLDVLSAGRMGTMEEPISALDGPGALMTAAAVGLFYDPERLPKREFRRLGAEAAALTHGDAEAFLSGASLSYILGRVLYDGETNFDKLSREASAMVRTCFGGEYHQARSLCDKFRTLRSLMRRREWSPERALEELGRESGAQVLMGALYLAAAGPKEADRCLELAARWSPGVAAVTGLLLGAAGGEEAIPAAWLEELEELTVLRELAEDMFRGCPMMRGSRVFDVEWDAKYDSADL